MSTATAPPQVMPEIEPEALERDLNEELAALAGKLRVPGVAVGVEHGGRRTYAYHGVTSLESPLPVDSRTLFQIGSNTKTFTATAVMRLVEAGSLELDAPVRSYLPDLKLRDEGVAARVTVLQLLNHTAGWSGDFFTDTGPGDDALTRYVARLGELDQQFPLGTLVSYNNAAFSTAGRVIERVTGQVYEDAIRDLVIEPLGLRDTLFPPAAVLPRRFAAGHFVTKDGLEVAQRWLLPRAVSAAGTLLSTPADMLRYARFHLGDGTAPDGTRLLCRDSLERMRRPTVSAGTSALGSEIGISWLLRDVHGARMVGHGGGTNGQISAFQTIPEHDFAAVILTNASIGGELHGDLLEWIVQRWLGIEPVRYEPLEPEAGGPDYAGVYRSQSMSITIAEQDGTLTATSEPTATGREWMQAFSGEQAGKLVAPPFAIELLAGERFRAKEGSQRPLGGFVRRDGAILALSLGGRLLFKAPA